MNEKNIVVAQFVDRFLPEIDGVVRVVENYAYHLSKNSESFVIAPKYKNAVDNYSFKVFRVASLHIWKSKISIPIIHSNYKIAKQIKKIKIDIYHAHSPFIVGHFALKLARKNKVPLIASFHSKYKDDFKQLFKFNFIVKLLMRYIMKFYNACDEVWACSAKTAEVLKSYGYKKEVKVMENGTDFVYPNNIDELVSKTRDNYNIDPNNKNLLFVGQLVWQKNLRIIFDVISLLVKSDPSYNLYLVGTSLVEKEMKDYVKKINISNNIHFLGSISSRETLKGIYAANDLFFFPSLYDNSPLVHREAASQKVPSLLCIGSTASEGIIDNDNGFLAENDPVALKDKIIDLFKDKDNLKKVGEKASTTIPITWDKIINKVEAEYNNIPEKHRMKYL